MDFTNVYQNPYLDLHSKLAHAYEIHRINAQKRYKKKSGKSIDSIYYCLHVRNENVLAYKLAINIEANTSSSRCASIRSEHVQQVSLMNKTRLRAANLSAAFSSTCYFLFFYVSMELPN